MKDKQDHCLDDCHRWNCGALTWRSPYQPSRSRKALVVSCPGIMVTSCRRRKQTV